VKATMDGLIRLRRPEEVAELRGLTVSQVLGLQNGKSADGEHLAAGPAEEDAAPADGVPAAKATPETESQVAEEAAPAGEADAPATEADSAAEETPAAEETQS
jgi:hypothetical protein